MKKSIKYAGIAAATLLAVAPVAAPVVSGTTNVQAAATNATTEQSVQTKSANDYMNQFTSSSTVLASELATKGKITPTNGTDTDLDSMNTNNAVLFLSEDANLTTDVANINSTKDASISVTAKSGNVNLTTSSDVNKYLLDETKPEVDITVTLTWYDLNTTKQTITKTIKATRATDATTNELTKLNVAYTTPVSVPLNSTVTDTQLTGTTGMKLTDQNGDGVFAGEMSVSPVYYATYAAAMKNATNTSDTQDTNIVENDKFVKAGTYYQAVTFTATNSNSELAKFISQYQSQPSKYTVYVNGQLATPGYDFTSDANTISVVRTVKVSNTTDSWTTTDTTGVVTTKTASKYYTLKNDDNVTIANRALGANTAWKTDKVRTNQDGVKQYRVATGEWIDADNVVYGENNNNNNNGSGLTEIKTVSGVATLTKPAGYFMTLFGDNGKALDNMMLASQTAWRVDRTAKDANGVTYYRVATGEWLQAGEGVSFK
ncbi:MAG TPA: hypothetical protein H9820_07005 [Candidatus Companilactobacillus pullicola]|uniref:Surface layer protein A domain-containing protein n=1 Tax=Candidatus Companilactobacillus pullicola TaxID=2838523 RepID=A0A9D1ZNA6_9LACO|nr:hypothetical protein [Candidatus Companilactobacillus pullicola]